MDYQRWAEFMVHGGQPVHLDADDNAFVIAGEPYEGRPSDGGCEED